jgi:hypothetical protein
MNRPAAKSLPLSRFAQPIRSYPLDVQKGWQVRLLFEAGRCGRIGIQSAQARFNDEVERMGSAASSVSKTTKRVLDIAAYGHGSFSWFPRAAWNE